MLYGIGLSNHVLSELEREETQLAVDFLEALFAVGFEVGTIHDKVAVRHLGKTHLLGCEIQCLALVVNGLDAGKKSLVEENIV